MSDEREPWDKRFRPFRAHEDVVPSMGELAAEAARMLETRHPTLLGFLVWTPDRVAAVQQVLDQWLAGQALEPPELKSLIRRSVVNQVTGLGPLDSLLLDDSVTEILINSPDDVLIERDGRLEPVPSMFEHDDDVRALAQRLAARAGRSLTHEHPMVDARLSDGSRISAVIPPVSRHTTIAIRRALEKPPAVADLLATGAVTEESWGYLCHAVAQRANIVIAGGAGSGKTHLMRLLVREIPAGERVVTIEDVRELDLVRPGAVALEAMGRHSMHDLFLQALRLRPDRILVGEVRGGEALDLIEAMGSGHPGGMTTVHSPGAGLDTIHRLARAALRSGTPLTFEVVCDQMLRTVELVVFLMRDASGRRSVGRIDAIRQGRVVPLWERIDGRLVALEHQP